MTSSIEFMINVLTENWSSALTDDLTPTIAKITESKGRSLADGDVVWLYRPSRLGVGKGNTGIEYDDRVSVDCRTVKSFTPSTYEDHAQKMEDEVTRIVEGNRTRPNGSSEFDLLLPITSTYLDDKNRQMGKRVIDVRLLELKDTGG